MIFEFLRPLWSANSETGHVKAKINRSSSKFTYPIQKQIRSANIAIKTIERKVPLVFRVSSAFWSDIYLEK